MNELLVKLDFNVGDIFDDEFSVEINEIIRRAVLDEFEKQVRVTTIEVYDKHKLDVSDAVLKKYIAEHAAFEASIQS